MTELRASGGGGEVHEGSFIRKQAQEINADIVTALEHVRCALTNQICRQYICQNLGKLDPIAFYHLVICALFLANQENLRKNDNYSQPLLCSKSPDFSFRGSTPDLSIPSTWVRPGAR